MKNNIEQLLESACPTLSPEAKDGLWRSIQHHLVAADVPSPYIRWVGAHTRLSAAFLLLMVVLLGGATSVRADEARPGDFLFPIDRALERVTLALAPKEKRDAIGNAQAEERLTELRDVIRTTPASSDPASDTHKSVGTSVDALLEVMDESQMSDTARERVYEKLFGEIDELSVDVKVRGNSASRTDLERVTVDRDTDGETRIEINDQSKRTRILKKDGAVKIEYDRGEVRGEKTSRGERESEPKKNKIE